MEKGKYEDDYYIICGARCTNGQNTYWVIWLSSGDKTAGFDSPDAARQNADRIVDNCMANPKLDPARL